MRQDRKESLILLVIILVLGLGIGYAFISTTLNMDGVSDIDSARWNIYMDNLDEYEMGIGSDQIITPATIDSSRTGVSYSIKLKEPGDIYEFYVDVHNDGTLPAKIDAIDIYYNGVKDAELPPYLSYLVVDYYNDKNVEVGEILYPGQKRKIGFSLSYKTNIDPSDLPDTNETISISTNIIFTQGTDLSSRYIYSGFTDYVHDHTGDNILPSFTTYNNYQDALATMHGNDFFMRYHIYDDYIGEYSVGFIVDGKDYYISGGDKGAAFEANRNTLLSIVGSRK